MFKTEPLYSSTPASGSSNKNLNNLLADDDEPQGEPPGLIQQILSFFSKLWSPSTSDAEKLGYSYVYAEDGSLLGEYGSGGSNSTGTAQYSAWGVARCPAQKTASSRPGLRCKSARYLQVSLWFAPCPDQKSIGFQRAAQRATPHDLPTASGPMPIAAVIKGQTYAVHSDHLNTPRKLTQPDGQVAWQWAYSAFGDEQPTIGAKRFTSESTTPTTGATSIPEVTFNLRYPGQYFDKETKLHYNYFRTYAPSTGRYTQGDPIGLDGGWNRFGYVNSQPLTAVDPLGLWSTDAHNYFLREFARDLGFAGQYGFMDQMMAGSRFADSSAFQSPDFTYMHGMSSPTLPPDEARKGMCSYVKAYMGVYNSMVKSKYPSDWGKAHFYLGMAMHAVMDFTSPAHRGFQFWGGTAHSAMHGYGFRHGPLPASIEDIDAAPPFRKETVNLMKRAFAGDFTGCGCE